MTACEKGVVFYGGKIFVFGRFGEWGSKEVIHEMIFATFERNNSFLQTI